MGTGWAASGPNPDSLLSWSPKLGPPRSYFAKSPTRLRRTYQVQHCPPIFFIELPQPQELTAGRLQREYSSLGHELIQDIVARPGQGHVESPSDPSPYL